VDDTAWDTIDHLVGWLDEGNDLPDDTRVLLQLLKITEEAGEVAEAVIGATGTNPRKGFSHTWDDVRNELCDVIVTAMVALTRLTPDAREVFAANLRRISERSLAQGTAVLPDA
jgi:NTP pyrophosphatase (non-canonical NTP hydrolase)